MPSGDWITCTSDRLQSVSGNRDSDERSLGAEKGDGQKKGTGVHSETPPVPFTCDEPNVALPVFNQYYAPKNHKGKLISLKAILSDKSYHTDSAEYLQKGRI